MRSTDLCNMTNTFTVNTFILLKYATREGNFIFRTLIKTFWLSVVETVPNTFSGVMSSENARRILILNVH